MAEQETNIDPRKAAAFALEVMATATVQGTDEVIEALRNTRLFLRAIAQGALVIASPPPAPKQLEEPPADLPPPGEASPTPASVDGAVKRAIKGQKK